MVKTTCGGSDGASADNLLLSLCSLNCVAHVTATAASAGLSGSRLTLGSFTSSAVSHLISVVSTVRSVLCSSGRIFLLLSLWAGPTQTRAALPKINYCTWTDNTNLTKDASAEPILSFSHTLSLLGSVSNGHHDAALMFSPCRRS